MTRRGIAVAVALGVAIAGCFLSTDFGSLSSGSPEDGGVDGPNESNADATSAGDASDATTDADAALPPPAWRMASQTGPSPRHSARLAFDDARGAVWLWGGWKSSSETASNELWRWDGTTWTGPFTPAGPGGRHGGGFAYDSARQVIVMFGGPGAPAEVDTWEWNGTAWAMRSTPTHPLMVQTNMAYDADRKATVLFGGNIPNGGDSGETWEWDGTTWTKPTLATAPDPRRSSTLAYDAARKKIVLFGGHVLNKAFADTWEYDGTWSPRKPATIPPERFGACMAYHAARGVTVLYGGRTLDGTPLGDTWFWDGNDWKAGPVGPPARSSCALAYDAARRSVVVFSGVTKYVDVNTREMPSDTWVLE